MRDNICICAIACGEEDYIAEWLEFHLLQGVEHFFLNINNPIDRTPEILSHYKDVVTLASYPLTKEDEFNIHLWQLKAYHDLVLRAKAANKYGWISIIDVDEFLWSPAYTSLPETLAMYRESDIGCIAVKWLMFGSNNQIDKKEGLVIERFLGRQNGTHPHCKSVFKTGHYRAQGGNCHTVRVSGNVVNERKEVEPEEYAVKFEPGTADILAINHYHLKSWEECMKRWSLRDGKATEIKDKKALFEVDNFNDVQDTRLLRFVSDIKQNIRNRNV